MSVLANNSEPLRAYLAAAAELHEFSFSVEKKIEEAGKSGNLIEAKVALSELSLRTKAFEGLRERVTPVELYIAKYSVVAHDDHTVSFVVPKGVSRIDILKEAQAISIALRKANPEKYEADHAIHPIWLEGWMSEGSFTELTQKYLALKIDGNVEGSTDMTRAEQEEKGWNNVALEDLVLAHTAFYLLTGRKLFEGNTVRAAGGALYFSSRGLGGDNSYDVLQNHSLSASRSLSAPN